jgi:hypothetical protein
MSEKCQQRKWLALFDHLVGADEQRLGHFDAERLGGLRFATNSNWVGCSTGRSPGFAPQGRFLSDANALLNIGRRSPRADIASAGWKCL